MAVAFFYRHNEIDFYSFKIYRFPLFLSNAFSRLFRKGTAASLHSLHCLICMYTRAVT